MEGGGGGGGGGGGRGGRERVEEEEEGGGAGSDAAAEGVNPTVDWWRGGCRSETVARLSLIRPPPHLPPRPLICISSVMPRSGVGGRRSWMGGWFRSVDGRPWSSG